MPQDLSYPSQKITFIGSGMAAALRALLAFQAAAAKGIKLKLVMIDKNPTISQTTGANLAFSLTPDEMLAVLPPADLLLQRLKIIFTQPGGIMVDDVPGVNDSAATQMFVQQLAEYNKDALGFAKRTEAMLQLGKFSMQLWQQLYSAADPELKAVFDESNFQPCKEFYGEDRLHAGYRIDLIFNHPAPQAKAEAMCQEYSALGYTQTKILTPNQVIRLDPILHGFCKSNSRTDPSGARVWDHKTIAVFRPGGCIDAELFLPKLYAYLERNMGVYQSHSGKIKSCFRTKFGRSIDAVVVSDKDGELKINALDDGVKLRQDKHQYPYAEYIFCPGEAVGTLHKLGFAEPAYAAFAGASLKLFIQIPVELIAKYQDYNHCMEVAFGNDVLLAWQGRRIGNYIKLGVGGTKAFYGDQAPNLQQRFARDRNLLELNIMNKVVPELISLAFGRDTSGQTLTAADLQNLLERGIAKCWVGNRVVACDAYPTIDFLYKKQRRVVNATTITHLGSGGAAYSVGVGRVHQGLTDPNLQDEFTAAVTEYARSNREYRKAKL